MKCLPEVMMQDFASIGLLLLERSFVHDCFSSDFPLPVCRMQECLLLDLFPNAGKTSPMKCHRLAIIGVGNRGTILTESAGISSPGRFAVVAVVDPDQAAADTFSRKFDLQGVRRFDTCDELLEAKIELDGAVVANPPHVHANAACSLIEEGVPIYLEKPMASDLGDALRIMEAADRSNTRVQVGFNLRYAPFFMKL